MSFKRKHLLGRGAAYAVIAGALALGTGALTSAAASAQTPLPAYPATTTLNLGSPYCVTDDVIMNDPLDSTSPITDTYGSVNSINSHATPPVTYSLWYLNSSNVWVSGPPPGVQINKTTGEVAAYDGDSGGTTPPGTNSNWTAGSAPVSGTTTYTIRDHGQDAVGAKGTTQYQIQVNDSGGSDVNGYSNTTVTYQGNDFNNAAGALTIQLNGGSTTSTSLTLSEIASSLGIPGSSPVTFTFANGTTSMNGWSLSGGSSTAVLTGVSASDPEFKAVTTGTGPGVGPYDEVFFTLSGISTTSGGVFYLNNDANPCINTTPPPVITPTQPVVSTGFGDFVNHFGFGFDVFEQHAWVNNPVVGWTAYAGDSDPAVHFISNPEGSDFQLEYAPHGYGDGLCISNPGNDVLVLRYCNGNIWQKFYTDSGGHVRSAVNNGYVNPDGKGAALTVGGTPTPWGGSVYQWVPNA